MPETRRGCKRKGDVELFAAEAASKKIARAEDESKAGLAVIQQKTDAGNVFTHRSVSLSLSLSVSVYIYIYIYTYLYQHTSKTLSH